jgi:dihydroxyacetone kinase-like protein
MGVAMTSCTVPSVGRPTFDLPGDQIEIGVGIHGEPGRRRSPAMTATEIVDILLDPIIDDLPFRPGDDVLAFVNGLGGTPPIELYVVYDALARRSLRQGLNVTRRLVGTYMTSLDMVGCSITLLRLDPELTRLWDAPVHTPGLRWGR